MSETSDRGGKPRKPAGPPGRGAAGGRRPTGSPQGNDSPKPRRNSSGDADRPKRDGDAKPRRDGDYKPRRDGDAKPRRDGDYKPRRDSDGKPPRRDGEYKPRRDADGKPPRRDGDYKPRRDGDARPPRTGDARPPRSGDARPPRTGDARPSRSGDSRPARSSDFRPARSGDGAPTRGAAASGRPRTGGPARPYRDGDRPARPPRDDRDSGPRHDDPHIEDDIEAKDLDKVARAELKTLSKDNADWVAKHLVMAGRLIDTDPALAHRHALAAARRAGRVGVVREAVGITAYAMGDFALALRELRTYRRITGKNDQLPLMVDSERGVGRPAAALELGRSVPRASLEVSVQVALAIAMSGARLDLGQAEAALGELQIPQLDPERAFTWSPALFDAYATVLEDLGHTEEAEQWWQRSDRATIALERADLPEGEDTVEIIEEELEVEPETEPADPAAAEPDTDAPTHD